MSNGNQPSGQGEFRGDFTRDTFDAAKHFSRVLMQQGRVQLDADWNEQTSIVLHYLRSLAADLIGQHGGPGEGFQIESVTADEGQLAFHLRQGRYYVDGILCEAGERLFANAADLDAGQSHLVFLDVWERHITGNEDGDIAEVALGEADTATRAQVMYRIALPDLTSEDQNDLGGKVKALKDATTAVDKKNAETDLHKFALSRQDSLRPLGTGTLRAQAKVERAIEACNISPESQYRGAENQLYRVEIHRGGDKWDREMDDEDKNKPAGNADKAATFKWSRENGSVAFPIRELVKDTVMLANLGRDGRRSLKRGDWVEIVDDDLASQGQAGELRQIKDIKTDEMTITLSAPVTQAYDDTSTTHPLLRRWDHSSSDGELWEGALLLKEDDGPEDSKWIALEDGVQIQFAPPSTGSNNYRAGDYWLIPARVAIGDVLWPKRKKSSGDVDTYPNSTNPIPAALPPHGIEHHYAPLGVIEVANDSTVKLILDLRRTFTPLAK